MNAVFAPDREHPGDRQPQPFSQADELKGTLALQPFRLQFISLAPDRGPSIVTNSRFKLRMRRTQSWPLRMSHFRPGRSDCASSTVKAARSLADGRAIAQGSTNDRDTVLGIVPVTWTPSERRFGASADEIKATPKASLMASEPPASPRIGIGLQIARSLFANRIPTWIQTNDTAL
jgi:hypothetical protein